MGIRLPGKNVVRSHAVDHVLRKPTDMPKSVWGEWLRESVVAASAPQMLIWVKTGDRRGRYKLRCMLKSFPGITVLDTQELGGGYMSVLLITGSPSDLGRMPVNPAVGKYEVVMSGRVPFVASGGGPEKVGSTPPGGKRLMIQTERSVPYGETAKQEFYPAQKRVNPDEGANHEAAILDSYHTSMPETQGRKGRY
jgi:hypothetical protein